MNASMEDLTTINAMETYELYTYLRLKNMLPMQENYETILNDDFDKRVLFVLATRLMCKYRKLKLTSFSDSYLDLCDLMSLFAIETTDKNMVRDLLLHSSPIDYKFLRAYRNVNNYDSYCEGLSRLNKIPKQFDTFKKNTAYVLFASNIWAIEYYQTKLSPAERFMTLILTDILEAHGNVYLADTIGTLPCKEYMSKINWQEIHDMYKKYLDGKLMDIDVVQRIYNSMFWSQKDADKFMNSILFNALYLVKPEKGKYKIGKVYLIDVQISYDTYVDKTNITLDQYTNILLNKFGMEYI